MRPSLHKGPRFLSRVAEQKAAVLAQGPAFTDWETQPGSQLPTERVGDSSGTFPPALPGDTARAHPAAPTVLLSGRNPAPGEQLKPKAESGRQVSAKPESPFAGNSAGSQSCPVKFQHQQRRCPAEGPLPSAPCLPLGWALSWTPQPLACSAQQGSSPPASSLPGEQGKENTDKVLCYSGLTVTALCYRQTQGSKINQSFWNRTDSCGSAEVNVSHQQGREAEQKGSCCRGR